ncbi:MAG: CRISPR-associated endonuclease Cas1 [Oscillochloris sp.]|nr:CRISPR-associated endonuclease Cas1 [Oscillochloris sp.]
MPTLYVNTQGAVVRKKDNQVLVMLENEIKEIVPINKLEHVVLMGRGVQMTSQAMISLLELGIPITLTNRTGSRHYATLTPGVSRFGDLRSRQVYLVNDEARALELGKAMISAKLQNQRAVLVGTTWPPVAAATAQIDAAIAGAMTAGTMDMLRGYEGAAAAAYFGVWRANLSPTWNFAGRAFYPPPDPVNAMLSFGYTMALNDMLAAVQITGLDPYLGTFHVIEAGRPSLALDLLEEFRPLLIDRLVLNLIDANAIHAGVFEQPAGRAGAVYLNREGRDLLVERYEQLMGSRMQLPGGERTTWRRAMELQAQAVARVIRGEQERYVGLVV